MSASKDLWMRQQEMAREAFDASGDEEAYRVRLTALLGGTEDGPQLIEDTIAIAKKERLS